MRKPVTLLCGWVRYSLHTLFWYRLKHDYSQGNWRTMSSIIIKLEKRVVYCKLYSNYILCMKIWLIVLTINKCTLLDCTNTEIRMLPTVHTFGSVNFTQLFWYGHTHVTFPPPEISPFTEFHYFYSQRSAN